MSPRRVDWILSHTVCAQRATRKTVTRARSPSATIDAIPRRATTDDCDRARSTARASLDRARLATQNEDIPPAPLVPASDAQPAGWKPPPLPPTDTTPPDSRPSSFESGPSSYSDKVVARKLARSLAGQGSSGQHQCPICFGAVEVAARVAGCAHVAGADCLSRWRVTKDVCPVCEGPVYGVVLDAQLDAENAQRRGLQSF